MRKILVCSSNRAERGLLEPVMAELKKMSGIDAKWFLYDTSDSIAEVVNGFDTYLRVFTPDIVVVPTDRFEITYVAARAFHQGYVVAHFHAGNNPTNTPDDVNRRVISCFSNILFCNMAEHKKNLLRMGEEGWRIYVVGSTAFDGIVYDDTVTPKKPFDLVILHPDPSSETATTNDLLDTINATKESSCIVWIYPNHDKNFEVIETFLNENSDPRLIKYRNLPRNQYFSILKNCTRAIGNSSSFYYELPVIDKAVHQVADGSEKLVQIGTRNRGLKVPATVTGGSRRIATILENIPLDEKLRKKAMQAWGT